MIDHISLSVRNIGGAKHFYQEALAPLGYGILREGEGHFAVGPKEGEEKWLGTLWVGEEKEPVPMHVAFRVNSRAVVDTFYRAALAAGGKDNGAPGIRVHYHENYYAAFVSDADGHNIEVVCHKP